MSYGNSWRDRHEIIAVHNYVSVTRIQRALDHCRRTPFSVKAERDASIAMVRAALQDPEEVNQANRFPAPGRFVNISSGPVAELIDKLLMSLDSGEHFMDREQASASTSKYSAVDDSKLAWIKITQKLGGIFAGSVQAGSVYGIFTRASFEEWYSLTWT